jgi:hypothetical protein
MAAYSEVNGVPAVASRWLLTEILREEWGFEGFVTTDWEDIEDICLFGVAASFGDAIQQALRAGADLHMLTHAGSPGHFQSELVELVRSEKLPEEVIDEAVRRILRDRASLQLPEGQLELIKAVYETETPTVVVFLSGRPLAIKEVTEHVPAILWAWKPGPEGGRAIADVLFGDYNPGGKLPISFPYTVGQIPIFYNYHPYTRRTHYVHPDTPEEPLFEFGYGLSYTEFEYSNLWLTPEKVGLDGEVKISVDVQNVGDREGNEVVQLYIRDVLSSVVRPVKELKGFKRITLKPGEKKTIEFTLVPDHLSIINRDMERVVEPGTFEVMVGSSSEDIRLTGSFEILVTTPMRTPTFTPTPTPTSTPTQTSTPTVAPTRVNTSGVYQWECEYPDEYIVGQMIYMALQCIRVESSWTVWNY